MPVFASKALICAFTWSTPADQAKKLSGSAASARPSAPKAPEPASAAAAVDLRKSRLCNFIGASSPGSGHHSKVVIGHQLARHEFGLALRLAQQHCERGARLLLLIPEA